MTMSEEPSKLAELRAAGTLTEDEFARAKARLLNDQGARTNEPAMAAVNSFRRSRSDRVFGGVCGGMARSTGCRQNTLAIRPRWAMRPEQDLTR